MMASTKGEDYIIAVSIYNWNLYGFWNTLEAAKDQSAHQNKLVAYLIELSCRDRWTATDIVQNRTEQSLSDLLASSIVQCLLSLKDQRNQAEQLVCPSMPEIDKDTVAILEGVAAKKNFDNSIQPIFACKTELSDQKQPSE